MSCIKSPWIVLSMVVVLLALAGCAAVAAQGAVLPNPGNAAPAEPQRASATAAPAADKVRSDKEQPNSDANIFQATLGEKEKTAEVSTAELQRILAEKSATVFDARPWKEFATSHIPGAVNVAAKPGVPMSQYVSDVSEVGRLVPDKAAPLVLYCNGPFCGKSKRLAEDLLKGGYTNVRRYQLGMPTWRALVGLTQIELEGVRYVMENDKTAVFVDARNPAEFKAGTVAGARNIPIAEVSKAKDDGRLPMEDHNTRIIVFGSDAAQARAVAASVAKNAFHNVAFYDGSPASLMTK